MSKILVQVSEIKECQEGFNAITFVSDNKELLIELNYKAMSDIIELYLESEYIQRKIFKSDFMNINRRK